ncbi:hypothetical protein C7212DRAFT_279315 [Tuber magnatum]|uniref:Distal membrane-arm assembly complex protein 1-like domain-containing protein n=1 Tax=Tuber magnatum TaxID=42249 RepID=A0A317SQK0_9PEZI|nr:hypothetical protein C7212DRAFT_279315 [Tuber magnatum]
MGKEEIKYLPDAPVPLKKALAEDREEDCLPCRAIGSAAFIGLGIYTLFSGRSQLRVQEAAILKSGTRWGIGARRLGIHGIAATLVGLGIYRMVM